jgi:phosphoglycolate phosphatase-like HAD superfamily hydrolase
VNAVRSIVLDFDGVVLESVDVKRRAFLEVYADHPEHAAAIERLHLENAGMSRYEKFVRIHEELLGRPCPEEEQRRLGERFSEIVYREILICPFVHGAPEFLDWAVAQYDLHVASATPHEEIRDIVARRGLDGSFSSVWGSPHAKADILRMLRDERGHETGELVYVGDALSDYRAAREAEVPFIGRRTREHPAAFPEDGVVCVVDDLAELVDRWGAVLSELRAWEAPALG